MKDVAGLQPVDEDDSEDTVATWLYKSFLTARVNGWRSSELQLRGAYMERVGADGEDDDDDEETSGSNGDEDAAGAEKNKKNKYSSDLTQLMKD